MGDSVARKYTCLCEDFRLLEYFWNFPCDILRVGNYKYQFLFCLSPFCIVSCRRWRRCTTEFHRTKWGRSGGSSKIWKLTAPSDLGQHLTMSPTSRPGWKACVPSSEKGRRKMAVLHHRNLLGVVLKMGAEAVAADRLFSTSVISNGWGHVACVWMSLLYGTFHLTTWWNACRE